MARGKTMGDTKQKLALRETNTFTDYTTGEIKANSEKKIVRIPKTPEFVMVFTKHLSYLNQLTKTEHNILNSILTKFVGYNNLIVFNPQVNADIMRSINVKKSGFSIGLKGLREKFILVEIEGFTYLNPEFFGKGNWEDIQRLRTEVVYDFDFTKEQAIQQVKQVASFVDDTETFIDSHQIVGLSKSLTDTGGEDLTLYVEEKGFGGNTTIDKEVELKQLAVRELELQLELKKMEQNSTKQLDLFGMPVEE
jgi:hypothetical protein